MTDAATDTLASYLDEHAEALLEHLNDDFAAAVLQVGRGLGGRPDATECRATAIDAAGLDAVVTDAEGDHVVRIAFTEPATGPDDLTVRLLDLVSRAQEVLGEDSTPVVDEDPSAIRTFVSSVVAVRDLHPHLREITFGGGLDEFVPNGPDAFVYVLLPPVGQTELTIDETFSWERDFFAVPEADRPAGAYYTVRRWHADTQRLDALFVLHGDEGNASAWALQAQVGDPVALWGPRTSWAPPADTDHYLLVADETGLPAVAGVLELLPPEASIQVVAEVGSFDERQELPDHPGATVTWLTRDGAAAGTATDLLVDGVRALEWTGVHPYVFGGGESRAMTRVRRYVRDERGCPREAVSLVAYWRHAADTEAPDADA